MKECITLILAVATVLIAAANLIRSISESIKTSKRNNLKILILDHGMKHFYSFFDEVENRVRDLKKQNSTEEEKKNVCNDLLNSNLVFQQKFIDLFFDVKKDVYEDLKKESDDLIDSLTEAIGDEGINLYVDAKFNEKISNKISEKKSVLIKLLMEKCD